MKFITDILVLIALILTVVFLIKPGSVILLAVALILVCASLMTRRISG